MDSSLDAFLDQIPEGLFMTDTERRIVFWNRTAEELAGFSREELLGRYCYEAEALNSLIVGPLHDPQGGVIGSLALFRAVREEYRQRKLALEIQKRAITRGELAHEGVRIDTLYSPVEEIGGDFLEAFFLNNDSLVATIADATGHGMSASLFTMVYKTLASDGLFESECFNGKAFGVPGVEHFFAGPLGERPLEDLLACVTRESKHPRLHDDVSVLTISTD